MAQYGQQLFGTAQHTHSAHPAPEEDESGVEALVEWREDAPLRLSSETIFKLFLI